MQASVNQLKEWFSSFNERYFDGELPMPVIAVGNSRTRLGSMSWRRRKRQLFKSDDSYVIRVSNYFDMDETHYKNVLLHEMIHLCIVHRKIRDTSAHGVVFRKMMESINADGWHVTVSARMDGNARRNGTQKKRQRLILATVTTGGKHILSVVNPRYAAAVGKAIGASREIVSLSWYVSDDDYFAPFPVVRTPKGRVVAPGLYAEMTARMKKTELRK